MLDGHESLHKMIGGSEERERERERDSSLHARWERERERESDVAGDKSMQTESNASMMII